MNMRPHLNILPSYMQRSKQMRLEDWLESTEAPATRQALTAIYRYYRDMWPKVPGSSHNHQAWFGGLRDHLAEMCRLGWDDYQFYTLRHGPLPFGFDDVLVAIFCHDAEKLVKNGKHDDPRCSPYLNLHHQEDMPWEDVKFKLLEYWEEEFGLHLTPEIRNAVKYTHGEPEHEYRKDRRVMNELAAFVGNLDRASARIFHSHGRGSG